jgi:hypothetical protein
MKLVLRLLLGALLSRSLAAQEKHDGNPLAVVISKCEFQDEPFTQALESLVKIAAAEHPEVSIPKIALLKAEGTPAWDSQRVTLKLEKVPLGEAMRTLATAAHSKLRIRGGFAYIEFDAVLDRSPMAIAVIPAGTQILDLKVAADTNGTQIADALSKMRPGLFSNLKVSRLAGPSSFLVEGKESEIELVEAMLLLLENGFRIESGK